MISTLNFGSPVWQNFTIFLAWFIYRILNTSNGKSSIVAERLYSFFFALFKKKRSFVFFRFSPSTQLLTKMFVLLRSWKILKEFTSSCFVFKNFWNTPIPFTFVFLKYWANSLRFTSFLQNFVTTWSFLPRPWQGEDYISFCFVLATLKTKPTCFRFDLRIHFVIYSFAPDELFY